MKRKILLTGSSGFLGGNFCQLYHEELEICGVYRRHKPLNKGIVRAKRRINDKEAIAKLIEETKPDAVIHLAAFSDTTASELYPEQSRILNVEATANIAELCHAHSIPMLFSSSDQIFDGENAPYAETDIALPLNVYGLHKLEAETAIRQIHPDAVICRLPLMYGVRYEEGFSFLTPLVAKAAKGVGQHLFTDEYRTVASARDVCEGMMLCLDHPGETYHLGGDERISRYDFGLQVCEVFGYDSGKLFPCEQKSMAMPVTRPRDVAMTSEKAQKIGWRPDYIANELASIKRAMESLGTLAKYSVVLLVAILFHNGLWAQSQPRADSLAHTLLWKITGKGTKAPSYLYGTMHATDDRVFRLQDSALMAFDSVQMVAEEINMDSIDQGQMAMEMMMANGQTLKDLLGKDDYKLAGKCVMKSAGIPIGFLNHIQPVYVWALIAEGKPSKKDNILDMYFFKLAKKESKPVKGLEKAEDQMKLLTGIPLAKQLDMLRESIHHYDSLKTEMNETTVDYADADLNKLYQETASDTSMGANFMEDFLFKRNRVMAHGIERILRSGRTVFTAVGADHLPGPYGVIALLRKDGYTVSPVLGKNFLTAKEVKKRLR